MTINQPLIQQALTALNVARAKYQSAEEAAQKILDDDSAGPLEILRTVLESNQEIAYSIVCENNDAPLGFDGKPLPPTAVGLTDIGICFHWDLSGRPAKNAVVPWEKLQQTRARELH